LYDFTDITNQWESLTICKKLQTSYVIIYIYFARSNFVIRRSLCTHSWYFWLRFLAFKRYRQAMHNSNHCGKNHATVNLGLQDIREFIYVENTEYKITLLFIRLVLSIIFVTFINRVVYITFADILSELCNTFR